MCYRNVLQEFFWTYAGPFLEKTLKMETDSMKIDTISIIPNTFSIVNVTPSEYRLDFIKAILYWKKKPALDSITITYRVFPFQLDPVAQRMSFDSVLNKYYVTPFEFNNGLTNAQKGIFDFGTLKAEGSFGLNSLCQTNTNSTFAQ